MATPYIELAQSQVQLVVQMNRIATVSGPAGSGKTTSLVSIGSQMSSDFRYFALDKGAEKNAVLQGFYEALYPGMSPGRLTPRAMKQQIVECIIDDGICVVADEVHHARSGALTMLAMLWAMTHRLRGEGFPLFLIGVDAKRAVSTVPELATRAPFAISIGLLKDRQLRKVLSELSARCAATAWPLLRAVDATYARGNLRLWTDLIDVLDPAPQTPGSAAITADEFRTALDFMGHEPVGLPSE